MVMTRSAGPWLTVLAVVVTAVVGRFLGPALPVRSGPFLVLVAIVGFVGIVLFLRQAAGDHRSGAG